MEPKLNVGIEAVCEFAIEEPLLTDVGGTLAAQVLSTPAGSG